MKKKVSLKSMFKKINTTQLSDEDRIAAKQITFTDTFPYPPFKSDYVYESDLKALKAASKKIEKQEKEKTKRAKLKAKLKVAKKQK